MLNKKETKEIVREMIENERKAFDAVKKAEKEIAKLTEAVIDTINSGGRIFYVGAGTSGRIGVLDASEIPPTFNEKRLFVPVIAGGKDAVFEAREQAEDSAESGGSDLRKEGFSRKDMAIGISASGRTPYVIGALTFAKSIGAKTAIVACNDVRIPFADIHVITHTGEEFVKGSTRLNAGTAEKLVLNIVSTVSMIKLGRTYDNLMVAVVPTNRKLISRAAQIVSEITGASYDEALEKIMETKDARIACLMIKKKISAEEARNLLKKFNNDFVKAYES